MCGGDSRPPRRHPSPVSPVLSWTSSSSEALQTFHRAHIKYFSFKSCKQECVLSEIVCESPKGKLLGVLKMCKISSSGSFPWLIIHITLRHDMMGVCFYIEGGIPSTRPRQAGSTGKDKNQTLAFIALRFSSSSVTVHSVHLPKTTLIGRSRCLRNRLTDRFLMTPLLFTLSK